MRDFYIYIMTNKKNGTLYIGVPNDLIRRVYEHKTGATDGFTKVHDLKGLVYFEHTTDVSSAITREKQLKKWNRSWKIILIEEEKTKWQDLYGSLIR